MLWWFDHRWKVKKEICKSSSPPVCFWRLVTENEDIQFDYVEKETNAYQIQEERLNITLINIKKTKQDHHV